MDQLIKIYVNLLREDRIRSRPADPDKAGNHIFIRESQRFLCDSLFFSPRNPQIAAVAFCGSSIADITIRNLNRRDSTLWRSLHFG